MAEHEYAAGPAPHHPRTAGHGPTHSNEHIGEQGNQHGHKGKGHQ
jgi:hypothetical protein